MQNSIRKSDPEIVVKLSEDLSAAFRGAASPAGEELEALVSVLRRHEAGITPHTPMGGVFPGGGKQKDSGYYSVSAKDERDAEALLRELRPLKGVEAAYKKPPSSCP
jgi:hypothetical protein